LKIRTIGLALLVLGLLVSAVHLNAAETPIPPAPTRWVTDSANFMSPSAASALDSRLQAYEQSTGHQLIVYIDKTTGDAPIEDWAVRAFEKWKVGRKGIDDGLVLFIMAADRKLRFEVGYGLEGQVPDAIASRVINDVIVPRIQAGNRDAAVIDGMDAIMTVIGGGTVPAARTARRGRQPASLAQLIFYGIIGLIVLLVLITNPSLAMYLLFSILSGGGGGRRGDDDWGGGGGGFSGGGGRSGGGGASGSW
jgi:uncharacterized protein